MDETHGLHTKVNDPLKSAVQMGEEQKFEALKMHYEQQYELLRYAASTDQRIVVSFITLQILLGGWFAEHPLDTASAKVGIFVIDGALAVLAAGVIRNNNHGRRMIGKTLRQIETALRFWEPGAYLKGIAFNAPYDFRPWRNTYLFAIFVSLVGLSTVLFADFFRSRTMSNVAVPVHDQIPQTSFPSAPKRQ